PRWVPAVEHRHRKCKRPDRGYRAGTALEVPSGESRPQPRSMAEPIPAASERRRLERRTNPTLAELTLPELRRMMVTTVLFVVIVVLFLWMVRSVIIASILGVIVASYLRPVHLWLLRRIPNAIVTATLTLLMLIGPVLALSAYSYEEIADV